MAPSAEDRNIVLVRQSSTMGKHFDTHVYSLDIIEESIQESIKC